MELFLINHDYKYAAEQIMLLLFPNERPVYPEAPTGDLWASIKLTRGKKYAVASCRLRSGSKTVLGRAAVSEAAFSDPLSEARCLQRIVKKSFYRAGLALASEKPPWGSVTGVRPGKLMSVYLSAKMSDAGAKTAFMKEYDVSPERAQLCLETAKCAAKTTKTLATRDVCLYVGIPFCPTRCAYCSFVSQAVEKSGTQVEPYLKALLQDISETARAARAANLNVISIYFGGGTPTALTPSQLSSVCAALAENFDLSACREYTMEAGRPDTITKEKLEVLKTHGITRISVNPQSMNDAVLRAIGRGHTARDVEAALRLVRAAGDFSVNMDLIAGLPGDDAESFKKSLLRVLELNPENITVHTLALKKGSRISLEKTALCAQEQTREMVDFSREVLRRAGFSPYYLYRQKYMSGALENIGWSRPGHENLYNICIMEELCGIISMGAGASTKLISKDGEMLRRYAPKYPKEYIEKIEAIAKQKTEIKEFYQWHTV